MPNIGISLGNVCYSAQWAVENGYRKTKENGYQTCPFDLMVSNYQGIVWCIWDNFEHFCELNHLTLTSNGIFNTYYHFGFNHESPGHANLYLHENWPEGTNHFVNNHFKHFIDRYNRRIQSFRNYLSDPNNYITFIIQFANESNPNNDCQELRYALASRYPHLKYNIVVLS